MHKSIFRAMREAEEAGYLAGSRDSSYMDDYGYDYEDEYDSYGYDYEDEYDSYGYDDEALMLPVNPADTVKALKMGIVPSTNIHISTAHAGHNLMKSPSEVASIIGQPAIKFTKTGKISKAKPKKANRKQSYNVKDNRVGPFTPMSEARKINQYIMSRIKKNWAELTIQERGMVIKKLKGAGYTISAEAKKILAKYSNIVKSRSFKTATQVKNMNDPVYQVGSALEGRARALEGRANVLEGRASALEGRASKLEGRANLLEGRAKYLNNELNKLKDITNDANDNILSLNKATYRLDNLVSELNSSKADAVTVTKALKEIEIINDKIISLSSRTEALEKTKKYHNWLIGIAGVLGAGGIGMGAYSVFGRGD